MNNFPPIVTLRLTSKCNSDCRFCFNKKGVRDMSLAELKEVFQLFSDRKVKAVRLTGGEPLIREDFGEIIREIKKFGFRIFLDTNGDFFFRYSDVILDSVEVLGLPIDYPDRSDRNPENFSNVLSVLDYLKEKKNRPLIRIGTLVTKANIADLEKIGLLLANYPIEIWKLYEFVPQNERAVRNRRLIEVDRQKFESATTAAKKKFGKRFKVVVGNRADKNKAYFFVRSDGIVFMPVDGTAQCKEVALGNVFDKGIVEKWKETVIQKNYSANSKKTLNFDF